jgi:hypothetical protein
MKKINIIGLFVILSATIPSVALAAWWNPADWFGGQSAGNNATSTSGDQVSALDSIIAGKDQEIAKLEAEIASSTGQAPIIQQKTIMQTVTVKDPTEESDIAGLTTQLAKAQTQYALCQGQFNSVSSATQASTNTTNANSAQIKSIEGELATLSQIDFEIDNDPLQNVGVSNLVNPLVGTSTLLNVLNNSMKLDGTMLFSNVTGDWWIAIPAVMSNSPLADLQPQTSTSTLHQIVKSYRIQLEGELEADGGVNENVNLPQ